METKTTTEKLNYRLLFAILLPLTTGAVSSMLSSKGMRLYQTMEKPPLSPPAFVFPIAWTLLYLMMGTASYMIWSTDAEGNRKEQDTALLLYLLQLVMNFFWSIFFFGMGLQTLALVWLMVMFLLIILCTGSFFFLDKTAGWLMIPYNVWMAFALYLNAAIVFMHI